MAAETVTVTKEADGVFNIVVVGSPSYNKPFSISDWTAIGPGLNSKADIEISPVKTMIKLVAPDPHYPIMAHAHPPEEWTIGGVSGFTTTLQVAIALTALSNS